MEQLREQLKEQGYAEDQISEIEAGIQEKLDVSVYSKKEFLAIQMHQIRLGLQQGLAVEKYAKAAYDWFQMEEIRKGLQEGIQVDLYAFPEVTYDRMHQIREGLCAGIDLSTFRKLNAGVLKELRLAIQSKINIVPYITVGYDAEQLEAIRMSLEKGLNIDAYLKKEYRGISIHEIRLGLENDLNVSIYAKVDYCWQQMREIRLGLEHRIDVEQYTNPFYSWQQMKEIRLGLENGLDVSYYKSFLYTAYEMQKRRIMLQDNPAAALAKEEIIHVAPISSGRCKLTVSEDEMEVYLEVQGSQTSISRQDILKELRNHRIVYGIQYDVIDEVIKGNTFRKPVRIAKGSPCVDGKDGWYEYFFRTEVARTPKELEQGNVDYRNVEWFETVEQGQKLAYYHSASKGENGTTVTGTSIPARKGREKNILTGTGFKRLPDERTYVAAIQGIVTIHNLRLEVSNLLVMPQVNLATGNVSFDGNVYIRGNVSSGTKINATGDIVVDGYVEASEIVCGGNAVLKQGMNASDNGFLHAGKNVIGCFFEATQIYAGGNIQGDYFLNCRIHTEEYLFVNGKKGMLAGGDTFAEKGLTTYNLGNQVGLSTLVRLGISERMKKKEKEINEAIQNVNGELYKLGSAHRDLQRKFAPEVRNTMDIYLKIESAVYTKEKEMEELLYKKRELEEQRKQNIQVSAVIENRLFEGVTVEIDGVRWRAKPVKGVIVKKKNNNIVVFSK